VREVAHDHRDNELCEQDLVHLVVLIDRTQWTDDLLPVVVEGGFDLTPRYFGLRDEGAFLCFC
jgi:hypothetical protein